MNSEKRRENPTTGAGAQEPEKHVTNKTEMLVSVVKVTLKKILFYDFMELNSIIEDGCTAVSCGFTGTVHPNILIHELFSHPHVLQTHMLIFFQYNLFR